MFHLLWIVVCFVRRLFVGKQRFDRCRMVWIVGKILLPRFERRIRGWEGWRERFELSLGRSL